MIMTYAGKLVKVAYTYRVEVTKKSDVEVVRDLITPYGAGFKRGKAHGNPGEYRIDCFVEVVDPFVTIDALADKIQRFLPDAKVCRGGMMEVEVIR